jgi:tetratricopeptide (TPR) repeat protein
MAARSLHLVLLATLLAFVVLAAPPARAGEPPKKAEARDWYRKGIRHYELGELDLAAQELKRAYELNPAPGLLFNLGQVYRLKKDDEQALHFYRTYLRLQPDAGNRSMVESLMTELRVRIDDKARRPRAAPATPEPAPAPAATTPTETPAHPTAVAPAPASSGIATLPPPAAAVAPAPPPPSRWKMKLWIGGAATAAGLGALGAAVGLGVHANSIADELARDSNAGGQPWNGARQSRYDDGERSAVASTALYVVGGALVAGGVVVGVLGLRERQQERRRRVALVPSSTDGVGAACAF